MGGTSSIHPWVTEQSIRSEGSDNLKTEEAIRLKSMTSSSFAPDHWDTSRLSAR